MVEEAGTEQRGAKAAAGVSSSRMKGGAMSEEGTPSSHHVLLNKMKTRREG